MDMLTLPQTIMICLDTSSQPKPISMINCSACIVDRWSP